MVNLRNHLGEGHQRQVSNRREQRLRDLVQNSQNAHKNQRNPQTNPRNHHCLWNLWNRKRIKSFSLIRTNKWLWLVTIISQNQVRYLDRIVKEFLRKPDRTLCKGIRLVRCFLRFSRSVHRLPRMVQDLVQTVQDLFQKILNSKTVLPISTT